MRIVWEDFSTWDAWLARCLRSSLKPGATQRWQLRARMLSRYSYDDGRWLEKVLAPELRTDLDSVQQAVAAFRGVDYITAFHGTRLRDPGIVHRTGLQVASWGRREAHLTQLLTDLSLPLQMAKTAFQTLREQAKDIDLGKLFLQVDGRDLVEQCGHYLLLGSEFAAGQLRGAMPKLRELGVPTVFVADVPVRVVQNYFKDELAWLMLHEWTRLRTLGLHESRAIDRCVILHSPLAPECVRYHFHPQSIHDPHNGCVMVHNTRTSCQSCIALATKKSEP